MEQHIKKIQFLVIAIFTIILSSCGDDLYHQGSKPVTKNKTVSIEEFKRNTGLHNFSKTFKIPKDNTIAYRNADGSYELSDFDINFDYIKQVVVENKISYTFNIIPKIVTSKSIFNLVVYNHDGNWETSILELIPTEDKFDKLLSGIDNKFEGNIKQVYSARIPGNCYTVAYYVENCTYGDSDACRISCDQCNLCMTLVRYNVCNDTEIMQPLYPISGGGGGVGSGLSDPSGYIFDPNMYELGSKKYQQAKNAAEFWHGLSVSQQRWVYENENNIETYRNIIAYINRPENIDNTEAKSFGNWAITYFMNNPSVSWTQFKNWFMGKSEGNDGEFNSEYWNNPNLTFPQQSLPSFDDFKNACPDKTTTAQVLCNEIGGEVLTMHNAVITSGRRLNTCAIRISKALNGSGVIIPEIPDNPNGTKNTVKGSDGKNYIINAKTLNAWMKKTFGTNPQNYHHITSNQGGSNGVNFPNLINGMQGIYTMVALPSIQTTWGSGHADLLENGECRLNCHFYDEVNQFVPVYYIDIWILN